MLIFFKMAIFNLELKKNKMDMKYIRVEIIIIITNDFIYQILFFQKNFILDFYLNNISLFNFNNKTVFVYNQTII